MKILFHIICYIIYPFSFLFPRSKKKYAFGSSRGSFNDNAKYLFLYTAQHCPDIDVAWVSLSRDTVRLVRSYGFKAYSVFSLAGVWHALTSRYWFFNSYTSDIMFCLSGRAVCFNLWHGLAIKRIEYNITSGDLAGLYAKTDFGMMFTHPQVFRKPNYLLSSSSSQTGQFSTAFRVPTERCKEFGYPRCHILLCDDEERMHHINHFEPQSTVDLVARLHQYNKVYIYMPTWRDSQRTVFTQSMDLARLNQVLAEHNELLLLKPHSNVEVDATMLNFSNIVFVDGKADVYPILPYTDVLITDYSSVLYDYLLMDGKGVILYLYDLEEYEAGRSFIFPFFENVTGTRVNDFDALLNCIDSHDFAMNEAERKAINDRFWGDSATYNANQKILDFIKMVSMT